MENIVDPYQMAIRSGSTFLMEDLSKTSSTRVNF